MAQELDGAEALAQGRPGFITNGRLATFCEGLTNQTEITVKGRHFLQEASGPEVGKAVAAFVRSLRDQR